VPAVTRSDCVKVREIAGIAVALTSGMRLAAVLVLATSVASADPPPERERCAAEVADKPLPGDESGRTDADPGDSTARVVGRDLLYVPKLAVNVALAPVRGGIWLFDRYQLDRLYYRVFFNDARTIGLYPTVGFESGFGITGLVGGARFTDRDVFGEHEHFALQAAFGTAYYFRQLYSTSFRTGERFGDRFELSGDAGYELRPRDAFYGIGNSDPVAAPVMPIDPRADATAIETRYSQHRGRVSLVGDARVWNELHLRPGAAFNDITFAAGQDGTATDMAYAQDGLVGWNGVRSLYGELEVRWDTRSAATRYEPRTVFATGSLVGAFGGRYHRLDAGNDFWRYGFDAQQFFRIAKGPRVIALRAHAEAVSGSLDDVPFAELPKLGGGSYLRGYALDRFRDRAAAFTSAAYEWDLSSRVSASLFVDLGRVYPSLTEISVDHVRAGYGFGIDLHESDAFVLQASVASSIDGGLFITLAFNPVFDLDERVRRNR
jgi:hypothetical protein